MINQSILLISPLPSIGSPMTFIMRPRWLYRQEPNNLTKQKTRIISRQNVKYKFIEVKFIKILSIRGKLIIQYHIQKLRTFKKVHKSETNHCLKSSCSGYICTCMSLCSEELQPAYRFPQSIKQWDTHILAYPGTHKGCVR